jgi:hypothetical protein
VGPVVKKRRHHSIDFNALVEKIELKKVTDTAPKERKCVSQMKHLQIDVGSVGRQSCDGREWDHFSANQQTRQTHFGNSSVKSREFRGEVKSQLERKPSRRKSKPHNDIDVDYRGVINRVVRENRRLQTEHVREIYSREMRESVKKQRYVEVPEGFWKKRQTLGKGQTRYADKQQRSSKKAIKT